MKRKMADIITNQKLYYASIFFLVLDIIAFALYKLKYEIIIYSSAAYKLFSLAISILTIVLIISIFLFAVVLVSSIKKKNKNHIVLSITLVLISLFLSLLVYYQGNNQAITTLISPVVISKDTNNNTISVLPYNSTEEIILTCTSSETVLIEVGKEYRTITYRSKAPEYLKGYLQQISVYE